MNTLEASHLLSRNVESQRGCVGAGARAETVAAPAIQITPTKKRGRSACAAVLGFPLQKQKSVTTEEGTHIPMRRHPRTGHARTSLQLLSQAYSVNELTCHPLSQENRVKAESYPEQSHETTTQPALDVSLAPYATLARSQHTHSDSMPILYTFERQGWLASYYRHGPNGISP